MSTNEEERRRGTTGDRAGMAHAGHNSVYEAAAPDPPVSFPRFFPVGIMNAFACPRSIRHDFVVGGSIGVRLAGKTAVVKSDSRRGSWTRESVGEVDGRKGYTCGEFLS